MIARRFDVGPAVGRFLQHADGCSTLKSIADWIASSIGSGPDGVVYKAVFALELHREESA